MNKLMLCPDNMEALVVGPDSVLGSSTGCELILDGIVPLQIDQVCSLGVVLYPALLLDKLVSMIATSGFYQIQLVYWLFPRSEGPGHQYTCFGDIQSQLLQCNLCGAASGDVICTSRNTKQNTIDVMLCIPGLLAVGTLKSGFLLGFCFCFASLMPV